MAKIAKFKEGEKVWEIQSKSGRSALDIHIRMRERLDRRGFFTQELNGIKSVGIVVGTGDNCLKFYK